MKEIKLTRGMVALVDDADFEYLSQFKWQAYPGGATWYAQRTTLGPIGRCVQMHRDVMVAPKGIPVDHIDGDGLNNQRSNLRFCTQAENMRNRRKQPGTSSVYKGVTWDRDKHLWVAQIQTRGKTYKLGRFSCEEDAARTYNEAASRLFGEFARLNQLGKAS